MNTAYWDLFWRTGMPEAWLMLRGGGSPASSSEAAPVGGSSGHAAEDQARAPEDNPGGSGGFS